MSGSGRGSDFSYHIRKHSDKKSIYFDKATFLSLIETTFTGAELAQLPSSGADVREKNIATFTRFTCVLLKSSVGSISRFFSFYFTFVKALVTLDKS